MVDYTNMGQLEQLISNMRDDHFELKGEVKTLTDLVRRVIVLEERAEGIRRAHQRIDTLVRMFWSGSGAVALAIFMTWFNRHQ